MAEIIAVLDTNVLISAFIGRGPPHKALDAVFAGKAKGPTEGREGGRIAKHKLPFM